MDIKKKIILVTGVGLAILTAAAIIYMLMGNKSYEVKFDSDGGTVIVSQTVKEGEKVNKPIDPIKEGYVFSRWEYENKEYDFTKPVEDNMILKAVWTVKEEPKPLYKVIFTLEEKNKELEISDFSDVEIDNLGFEEKDGYEIVWYLDEEVYDFSMLLTGDLSLTGKYVKVTQITVKFNTNGGSKVDNQKVKSGEKVVEPTNVTKYGFILDGWYLNNTKYDFSTPVTKNITLSAKWNEDPSVKRYTVKFDSNKGSSVSSQRVIEEQTATTPKTPTKSGYKFVEWQLDGKKYDFKTKVTKDITLKAKWEELKKYTVTFNYDNGSSNTTVTVTEGSTVSEPSKPSKPNYAFKEWQLDGKKYDFKTKVTKNITLVAVYNLTEVNYIVTFRSNGGSSVTSKSVKGGTTVSAPSNPTKSGYTFVEWRLNGTKYDFTKPVTQNITLDAIWKEVEVVKKDEYTITATRADNYSPDSILKVYKNNQQISVKEIKFSDGVHLCNGSKLVVTTSDIEGETTFIVVLNDGTSVKATRK